MVGERIKRITTDQTIATEMIERKIMKPHEVPPQYHRTLIQAVGVSENIEPEQKRLELRPGDLILLCSDGLSDMLTDDELEAIIRKHRDDMAGAADALITAANDNGGWDNISVVLVKHE
jgi:protein phosphatase